MTRFFAIALALVAFAFPAFAVGAEESKESVPAGTESIKLACKSLDAARLASEGFHRLLTLKDISSQRPLSEEEQAEQQGIAGAFPLMMLSQTCRFVREEGDYVSEGILEEQNAGGGRVTVEKARMTTYVVTMVAPRASDKPADNADAAPLLEGGAR
ncbi:MAG: hypothetical protein HYT22_00450 [Candidatus Niyogibacteria bacterium]|nr:hypothetical protein [Candidatus Niyogibacteria bacterium]